MMNFHLKEEVCRLTRGGHEPREPEITELDDAELRDEDVLGLDVAVDDLKEFPFRVISLPNPLPFFSIYFRVPCSFFFKESVDLIPFVLSVTPIKTSDKYRVRMRSACPNSCSAIKGMDTYA